MKKLIINTLKYLLRSKPLVKPYLKGINCLFEMSNSELEEYQNKRFIELFHYAYTKSKFYSRFYKEHGINLEDIKSIKDIDKLPIVTKDIVRENMNDIYVGCKKTLMKAHTSGTTGASLCILQSYKSVLVERAYVYKYRATCGFYYGEHLVSLRGHLDSKEFRLKQSIGNTLYLSSYQLNADKITDYYTEIEKYRPKAIEGYPSSIYNLCCLLKDAGLRLNIPICFTSSETLYEYQRALFKEILNCDTFDWYGCTEKTIAIAEGYTHNGFFELPGYSFNEFKDDCVITTAFINDRFPLIRYTINDIVTLKPSYKKVSAIDVNIEALEGRTENSIITKNGTIIGRLNFLFKDVDYVKLGQIVQREKGAIEINIVPEGPFGENQKEQIKKYLDERIGFNDIDFSINVISDNEVIYTNKNKFNQVVKF